MTDFWTLFTIWISLALISTFISVWLGIATALSEIIVGMAAQAFIVAFMGGWSLGATEPWITFLAGAGAIILTFLAGAELDPHVFKKKWREVSLIGIIGFIAPFVGCALVPFYFLNWSIESSLLAGVALSTTSVAVVYAVMLELGLNKTEFGKVILGACFVNDLATVIALGLIFSPFTLKTALFVALSIITFYFLPRVTTYVFNKYGNLPSEIDTKFILLILFGLGALASWASSEAVLPAYIIGMILAGIVGTNHPFIRRFRTLTFGFLTPFYFIRAGSLVSLMALVSAPLIFIVLLAAKMITKIIGVYPAARFMRFPKLEATYTTLMMSTGLTFGTIASLFGLNNHIITQEQYSFLVAAVIGSAIIPTMIANIFFLPHHLIVEEVSNKKNPSHIVD